ncbi:MAG: hypothetical protein CMG60_06385 [Candidatus Marinimicrobia bacterium]|nr:hypothetical protein [Candidatus Neomarinimicrobiota bacterium]|tara:strand:- start:372 stop:725 length:354 start_codon:yes stop_codon:yes gene_type:complete
MSQVDIKSFLIGILFTTLVFVTIGAEDGENSSGNFGDIVVNSITIKDDGHGGFITAYNQDHKRTLYLGTGKEGNGYVQTFNKFEEPTAYIGSNRDMDGVIVLSDRYGALGYTRSGKK